ncbi:MAG: aspartate aminotransferase [Nitrosomonadaceae bacterium]|nr:aspartate aminotransferase [Nitrosomonadaceae bacterium]|tara:strand:- start:5168 stop:6337 length:1170 start_codon:yes stop_codon:yes gene_type:complete
MKSLSHIAGKLQGQKMFQILAQAKELEQKGVDVIHLEIGDPDFNSPPQVIEAACAGLRNGHTHYTISAGMKEFREVAAEMTQRSRGFLPTIDQILVTPGANIQLYLAIACLVNPGEEVIITDPCFVSYTSIIELCGAKAVKVPLLEQNEFNVDPKDLRKAVTKNTRMIIINSPNNPTGALMTEEEIKEVYEIAESFDLYLLSDEVYGRMVYKDDRTQFFSPSVYDQCKKRTLLVHSFSKSYAMTGWRIGAVAGPEMVIQRMALLLETITSCVSPFIQMAAVQAMTSSQDYIDEMILTYRKRRDLIVAGLNDIDGIQCLKPGGAFYVFPNIKGTGLASEDFSNTVLANTGVATCPGNYFGEGGEGYVRFCYTNSDEKILEAIDRIKKFLS